MSDAPDSTANPFPGLRPYGRERRLYGRDRDLVLFRDRLYSARTTLLFAASGVGKSSFLQSKVVPELEEEHLVVFQARWGARKPLDALREAWVSALARHLAGAPQVRERVLAGASGDEASLRGSLDALWSNDDVPAFARRFAAIDTVLVLDQFEEPLNSLVSDPAIDALVTTLSALINDATLALRVVFSMRQEFLAELALFENRIPDLFANYYNLRHPTPDQAATIITLSVQSARAKASAAGVDALVDDLLRVSALQTDGGETRPLRFVVPPVLQIVCSRLWERDAARLVRGELEFAAGHAPGQAAALVQTFVDELLAKLDLTEQELLRKALDFLVARQGGKVAYELSVLAAHLHAERDALDRALTKLADEKQDRVLRRIEKSDGTVWFELYHDAYAAALGGWKARYDEAAEQRKQQAVRAAAKTSRKQTAIGCGFAALLMGSIATCNTAYDARVHRRALANAGDDFEQARGAYEAISGNPIKTLLGWFDADEELAKFWDRRTDGAALEGARDVALVYALEALAANDTRDRRLRASELVGEDLAEVRATRHTGGPIVALDAHGVHFATLARGGVLVSTLEQAPFTVMDQNAWGPDKLFEKPRVELVDVALSAKGDVVWGVGRRAPEARGNVYEQKSAQLGSTEPEFGLWRHTTRSTEMDSSWIGRAAFGAAQPTTWSVDASGGAAVCAWQLPDDASATRALVFTEDRVHPLGSVASLVPRSTGPRTSTSRAWEIAVAPGGTAAAWIESHPNMKDVRIRELDFGTGHERTRASFRPSDAAPQFALRYSPDRRWLALASESGQLHLVPLAGQKAKSFEVPQGAAVWDLAFDAGGRRLYASIETQLCTWDIESGTFRGEPALWEAEAPMLAGDDAFVPWDVTDGLAYFGRLTGDLSGLRWSRLQASAAEGELLFAPSHDGAECTLAQGSVLRRYRATPAADADAGPHWLGPVRATLSPDGRRALVAQGTRYALLDLSDRAAAPLVVQLEEELQVGFDFDAGGERANVVVDDEIRELTSGAAIDAPRVRGIARLFGLRDSSALLVEAEDRLQLVPTGDGRAQTIAQAAPREFFRAIALDPSRRRVATVEASADGTEAILVRDVDPAARAFEVTSGLPGGSRIVLALDDGGRRLAFATGLDGGGRDRAGWELYVFEATPPGAELVSSPMALPSPPVAIAFTPDGSSVVARTMDALVRIPLGDDAAPPSVRYLKRACVVLEQVPNWFDADDAKGERPRVLVLDAAGRLVIERVRFDLSDVEPVQGAPDALRSEWRRRLDLEIDGNGRVAPPSGSSRTSF